MRYVRDRRSRGSPSKRSPAGRRQRGGGLVEAVDGGSGITVRIGERRGQLPLWYLETSPERPTVQHAYAITGHIAQGMTVDRAFVLGSPEIYREWGYTAMSRGRWENRLYVVAPDDLQRQ